VYNYVKLHYIDIKLNAISYYITFFTACRSWVWRECYEETSTNSQ